jgi:hypothetical protein
MKLKKQTPTAWLGNGMGTTTADWVVVGAEHIAVRKLGTRWAAIDTTAPMGCGRIASADTKNDLVLKLETII